MRWRTLVIGLVVVILGWLVVDAGARAIAHRRASRLILQVREDDPARRAEALKGLQAMGPSAAPAAAEMLGSGDVRLRRAALLACGPIVADCLARFEIMNCVTGIVPERWGASRGFQVIGDALTRALADDDEEVRFGAARLLVTIPESEVADFSGTTRRALAVIRAVLESHHDPQTRLTVIGALNAASPTLHPDGISTLIEATNDPDEGVKRTALHTLLESLARWGSTTEETSRGELRRVAPLILGGAKGEDGFIHFGALVALGSLGESDVVAPLIADLGAADQGTRGAAAVALGRLGFLTFHAEVVDKSTMGRELQKSFPTLIACLDDPIADVRRHASHALGTMGAVAVEAVPALERAAEKERDDFVRHWMKDDINLIVKAIPK